MEDAPSEDEEEEEEASGSEKEEEEEEEEEKPSKKTKGKEAAKPGKQEDGSFKRAPKPNPFKAAIEKREAEKKAIQEARDVSFSCPSYISSFHCPLWAILKLSFYASIS